MKGKNQTHFLLISMGIGLLLFGGCAATPDARFYTLNSLSGSAVAVPRHSLNEGPTIGLGPIRFPDYLDRPGIVTRTGRNTIEIADFDLWAGSLKEDFMRVLSDNLSFLLKTDKVVIFPYTGNIKLDIRILINLNRFEGTLGDKAILEVTWAIFKGESKEEGVIQRSLITEPVSGSGYASLAAAQSRAVEKLGREIAQAVLSLSSTPPQKE